MYDLPSTKGAALQTQAWEVSSRLERVCKGHAMNTECALVFGTSSLSLASAICSPQQRMKLSGGGHPETVCDSNKQFPTFEYHLTKNRKEGDSSGKFHATGLRSLKAKDQPEGSSRQKSVIHRVEAAKNAAETMSSVSVWSSSCTSERDSTSTTDPDRVLGVQSVPGQNLASAAASGTLLEGDEERTKRLYALAALRQGRILGSRVFRQTYVIRSYEVCANGTTSIDNLLSLFQEVALNHVSLLGIAGDGFGATLEMNRYRLIWVITRLHVEVERYPTWPEAVEIDSWTDSAGKNGMRRDWLIREHGTGEIIARATSTWAMMNQDTRRLSKMPNDVRVEIEPTFVKRHAMGELTLERIPKLDNAANYSIQSNLTPVITDLDLNHHINNVTYVRWVRQSTPTKTLETHELSSITLEFRRESNKEDIVESLTNLEQDMSGTGDRSPFINSAESARPENPENGSSMCSNGTSFQSSVSNNLVTCFPSIHYIHLLRMQLKGEEIVRGRTVWKLKACWPDGKKSPQFFS